MSPYDYVIVGAGSAGCVLTSRLSEDPDVSVLLLEAGPTDDSELIHVPLGYLTLAGGELDWGYVSAPERECEGRRVALPRGKVLGGSSSTNAMIYIRGNPLDYDSWGVDGWSWAELLPCFLKAEDNERGPSPWHGVGGPLAVSEPRSVNAVSRAFLEAGVQAGLPLNADFNGESQEGVGVYQLTQRGGRRASAAAAYLRAAETRPNVTVMVNTQAHRVLFEGARATGVQASRSGGLLQLRAEREVLVCCGAYNSPQLLMLSGVGPADHLHGLGIASRLDLPAVGQNLSDHAATELLWMTDEPEHALARRRWRAARLLLAAQRGSFASNLAEAGGFARVIGSAHAPDTQFHVVPVQFLEEGHGEPEAHGIWVSPCLLTPHSRGTVRLSSSDPTAAPVVRNRFYTANDDLQRMIGALDLALEICGEQALERYCVDPLTVPASRTADALREHARHTTFAFYHPVGTCRMGADANAVVDEGLCVKGLDGLRVVDASVMPAVPRGNTNAPTIALAERAAELIRGGNAPAKPSAG